MLVYHYKDIEYLFSHPDFDQWAKEYEEETSNAVLGGAEVQFERYRALHAAGLLRVVIVEERDTEELVGASILILTHAMHYGMCMANVDAIYLRKPWRKGPAGLHLLGAIQAAAKREGAKGLVFMAPVGSPMGKVLRIKGATHTHECFWWAVDGTDDD